MKAVLFVLALFLVLAADAADVVWRGKGDASTRQDTGIYLWWNLGLRLQPGEYRVKARIRRDQPGAFTLKAVDADSGRTLWTKGASVAAEYRDLDFGTFTYDGSHMLRLTDWNEPGFRIESVTLSPVKLADQPDAPTAKCDTPDGWIKLDGTAVAAIAADKKEGAGALRVTVAPNSKRKWFDAGVLRPMPMKKASMVSFWIKFESDPVPFWVQIFTAEKGVARKLDPNQLEIRKGEWKFVELPVSTFLFKPQRDTVENLRALQFSPDAGAKAPVIFLLDDVLIEP